MLEHYGSGRLLGGTLQGGLVEFLLTIGTRLRILFVPRRIISVNWNLYEFFSLIDEGAESLGVAMGKLEGFSC